MRKSHFLLLTFLLFSFVTILFACSDNDPENGGEDKPDGPNNEGYVSQLLLESLSIDEEENTPVINVKYSLNENITDAILTISPTREITSTIEQLKNGSIEGIRVTGEGDLSIPFSASNLAGSYSVVMATFIDTEYYNYYNVDFYWSTSSGDIPSSDELENNTVVISYSEEGAYVVASTNIVSYISSDIEGCHVSLSQHSGVGDATGEITYILYGESSDGSFTLEGSYKSTVMLNGLSLTNPSGAAIDIQNGKRIKLNIAAGTYNNLSDGTKGSQKAALYCKGHLELSGTGALTVTGNTAHAISAKEYIEIKESEITVNKAIKDGINCNQYFLMKSGTVNISGTGDDGIQASFKDTMNREPEDTGNITISGGTLNVAISTDAAKALKADNDIIVSGGVILASTSGNTIWDIEKSKTKSSACFGADGDVNISGGSISLTATGSGGKGINCDNELLISNGEVNITTAGGMAVYSNGKINHNFTGSASNINSDYKSSPIGVKASGDISISGGSINVKTSGKGGEGIESKGKIILKNSFVKIRTYEEGIKSSGDLTINGGETDVISSSENSLDSGKNIYLEGGIIKAFGSSGAECGMEAGKGYSVYLNGGYVIAAGDGNKTVSYASQTRQAYVVAKLKLVPGSNVSIGSSTETFYTFPIPSDYNSSSEEAAVLISVPDLVTGSLYTIFADGSSTTATARTSGTFGKPKH